jgi:hypothetical protein
VDDPEAALRFCRARARALEAQQTGKGSETAQWTRQQVHLSRSGAFTARHCIDSAPVFAKQRNLGMRELGSGPGKNPWQLHVSPGRTCHGEGFRTAGARLVSGINYESLSTLPKEE